MEIVGCDPRELYVSMVVEVVFLLFDDGSVCRQVLKMRKVDWNKLSWDIFVVVGGV